MTAPRVPSIDNELWEKLKFTLIAIVIFRVGAHITAPMVDVTALQASLANNSATKGLLGLYDQLGGSLSRSTIFALGIMPYISASIVFQLAGGIVPSVAKMQKDEDGRKKLTEWTRYFAIAIAFSQAYTFTLFVEGLQGAVINPGIGTRAIMVATLTFGAIFVMWLGERITEHGIGNGMSLLIAVSILERIWPGVLSGVYMIQQGVVNFIPMVLFVLSMLAMVTAVVAMTLASRKIPIQIPRKVMGRGRVREGQKTYIPVRLITAGVMPIIFAQTVIIVPSMMATFTKNNFLLDIASFLTPGGAAYDILFGLMIILFSYFYTSIIFNSVDLSENLKKQGAFIPGVRPGSATADYIDLVLGRITLPGSIFLALLAIIPITVANMIGIGQNFRFGGTSLLIVVGVLLDTIAQIEQHRALRKYDGFMKSGRVKFRGRQSRFGM